MHRNLTDFHIIVFYSITLLNYFSGFSVTYFQITIIFGFSFIQRKIQIPATHTYLIYTHSLMTCSLHFSWLIGSFRSSSTILNCDVDSGPSYFSQRSIPLNFTERAYWFCSLFFILYIWLTSTFNFIDSLLLFSLCIFIPFSALYTLFILLYFLI